MSQIDGITVEKVKEENHEHIAFLEEAMQPSGIVMSHFAPFWQPISPAYVTSEVNGYYATDLEEMILRERAALWVQGQIHADSDCRISETRVVCDPAGYGGRDNDPLPLLDLG